MPSHLSDVVLAEVIYSIQNYVRKGIMASYARDRDDLQEFIRCPRLYILQNSMSSGWKISFYRSAQQRLYKLFETYPVSVDDRVLIDKALDIGVQTGYDWVDCWLLAQHCVYGVDIVSVDRDIITGLNLFPFIPEEEVLTEDYEDLSKQSGDSPSNGKTLREVNLNQR